MKPNVSFLLILQLLLCRFLLVAQESLSLQQALMIGLENNYSIVIQKNNAEIAGNNNTVGNAGFLPDLSVSATQNNTFSNTHQEMFNGTVKDITGARNRSLNASMQLSWTLFDGLSMFVTKDMLEVMEEVGETNVRIAVENTLSGIIQNYYGIVQQQKLIQVLEDALELSRERRKITKAKIELGAGSEYMLLQSTVDLNTDSINLIREQASLRQTMANLNRLLARDPATPFLVTDTILLQGPLNYDNLLINARSENRDLQIARKNSDLSVLALKDAQSQRYPMLNFQAAYNYNQLNSQTGFLEYNQSYGPSFGFTISYPIFNGFNVNRTIANAKVELHTQQTQVRDTELSVQTDLYTIFIDYITNLQIVDIEIINQEVARKDMEVAFEKYRLGSISDIDLRETQKKYIDAQYQLLLSEFQAKQAETELLQISGELGKMLE